MASEQELQRRLMSVHDAIRHAGLDALVLVSDARHNEQQGDVRYLSDFPLWCPQKPYLVVAPDAEPIFILSMPSEAHWAKASGMPWSDVRRSPRPIDEVVRAVAAVVGKRGTVGVSGLSTLMPVQDYLQLKESLLPIEIVDATSLMQEIRKLKSPEELVGLRESAKIAEAALAGIAEPLAIGKSEREVALEVERVARSLGAGDVLILSSPGPYLRPPGDRLFEPRDFQMFSLELSGPEGYWAETGSMLSLGEPEGRDLDLFRVCSDAFDAGLQQLKPGATCSELADAVRGVVEEASYSLGIWGGHGIGLDIPEEPSLVRSAEYRIQQGMTFAFHPHVVDPKSLRGAYISDSFEVSSHRARPLGAGTPKLIVA